MSFNVQGAAYFDGTLTGAYGYPIVIGTKVKWTWSAADVFVHFANTNTEAVLESIKARAHASTTDRYRAEINDAAATSGAELTTNIDGVWTGLIFRFLAPNSRFLHIGSAANVSAQDTVTRDFTEAFKFLRLGGNWTGTAGQQMANGLLAEVAIWNADLNDTQIDQYMGTTPASSIGSPIVYCPGVDNANNLGSDSLASLTATGGASFDGDHPTIAGAGFVPRSMLLGVG